MEGSFRLAETCQKKTVEKNHDKFPLKPPFGSGSNTNRVDVEFLFPQ